MGMNGGQIIAARLQKHGVKTIFTLCGGHISPILVASENSGIKIIDTRHEASAVFAADAMSRLTGIPGVAAVTAGPGLTNSITALKNAALAQSSLVLLGGATATILKGRGSLQDINQISIAKSVCKWAATVSYVKDYVHIIDEAFFKAKEGVPGPVYIECPMDTLYSEELVRSWYSSKKSTNNIKDKIVQWYVDRHVDKIFSGKCNVDQPIIHPVVNIGSENEFQSMYALISKSKKPLMIVGSGCMFSPDLMDKLKNAVSDLKIPVYLSGMARGLLGDLNELQIRHHRKDAIKESDLVILLGVPNDFRLDYGRQIGSRKLISVNRSTKDLRLNHKPTLAIHADPQGFIISYSKKFKTLENTDNSWLMHLQNRDTKREIEIEVKSSIKSDLNKNINSIQMLKKLNEFITENSIIIADGGDFVGTAAYVLRPKAALSWLDPGVFGTLGVGAGFAMAAKIAFPDKDIWIIFGDGSSGYSLIEYDSFVRHKLPIISIIGNDACWGQIARDQVELLHSECAIQLSSSHYEKVAEAFDASGKTVRSIHEFAEAIVEAKDRAKDLKPFLINAIIAKTDFRKGSISV